MNKNKIYFASDFHLGVPDIQKSHAREKKIINWLNQIEEDAKAIYLLGDIFDFWFEYKRVVPKGFVRILGKLAEMTDNKIEIYLFVGNHDLWMKDYLNKEVGINIHYKPRIIKEQGKEILVGHGDGLGYGDYFYKFIRQLFNSKICKWGFARLHPNFGLYIAHALSKISREKNEAEFSAKEDILYKYCKRKQKNKAIDYYIFGHRHTPLKLKINNQATYINLGDWINHNTYAVLYEGNLELKKYNPK